MRGKQVLLVHRAHYGDWTFPKGKLEPGETWEQAALREVEEETGLRCELEAFLGSTFYDVGAGRKEVRWWSMASLDDPSAAHEVDAVRWASPDEARALLTYDRDLEILGRALQRSALR